MSQESGYFTATGSLGIAGAVAEGWGYEKAGDVVRIPVGSAHCSYVIRDCEGGYTHSEDELIMEAGNDPNSFRRWASLRNNNPCFRNKHSNQLRERYLHLWDAS